MSSVKLKASIGSMIDVHAVATLDGWLRAIGSSLLPFAAVGDWGRGGEHLFCIKPYRRRPLSVTPTHPFSRAIIESTTSVLTRAPYMYSASAALARHSQNRRRHVCRILHSFIFLSLVGKKHKNRPI